MNLIRVNDSKSRTLFLDVAREIYRNDPVWVCPLDNDMNAIFDPAANPYFSHGELERWILKDAQGRLAGRIAAFIDRSLAFSYEQPTGGIGFFECINNRDAAFMLFDTAREWLKERGMEAMDGPVNFGETDKYWGLLTGGFTHPSFEVPYNHAYYRDLFEEYGFRVYYTMEGFHLDLTKPLPERFMKIARWLVSRPGYSFRHFTWKEQEKFVNDFAKVFNEAWASFKKHFEPLQPAYINGVLRKAKPIVEEEFIWIAYFNEEPVAIYLMFPDLNQILKHLDGRLDIIGILKFMWYRQKKAMTRAKGLLMGVVPKFQNHGIESGFILQLLEVFSRKPHYTEVEFSWVADFNPRMRKLWCEVGGTPAKNYATYRYLFDRSREFKRYPLPEES